MRAINIHLLNDNNMKLCLNTMRMLTTCNNRKMKVLTAVLYFPRDSSKNYVRTGKHIARVNVCLNRV